MEMTATLPTATLPRVSTPLGLNRISPGFAQGSFVSSGSPVPVETIDIYSTVSGYGAPATCEYFVVPDRTWAESEKVFARLRELFRSWHEYRWAVAPVYTDWIWNEHIASPAPRLRTPVEQLDDVTMTFSLNTTQTADVFGVSRPTIYEWRRGAAPGLENRARLNALHELAEYYRSLNPAPIGEALTWTDTSTGRSLLDLLTAQPLDREAVLRCLAALPHRISDHFAEADADIARNAADGWPAIPERWRKETRRRTAGRNVRPGNTQPF
jgi:hypothetical protein